LLALRCTPSSLRSRPRSWPSLFDLARARGRRRTTSLFDRDGDQCYDPPARSAGPAEVVMAREWEERLPEALAQAPPLVRDVLALREQGLT